MRDHDRNNANISCSWGDQAKKRSFFGTRIGFLTVSISGSKYLGIKKKTFFITKFATENRIAWSTLDLDYFQEKKIMLTMVDTLRCQHNKNTLNLST